jgi:hypothetical protein
MAVGFGLAEGREVGVAVGGMGVAVGGRSVSVGEAGTAAGLGGAQPLARDRATMRIAIALNAERIFLRFLWQYLDPCIGDFHFLQNGAI